MEFLRDKKARYKKRRGLEAGYYIIQASFGIIDFSWYVLLGMSIRVGSSRTG